MPSSPHDALFRKTFSDVHHAAAELRSVLPTSILRQLDLSTLQLVSGTFVDSELAASESDLLFSASFGGRPGFLYLLCEHQSTVDALMAFRILEYVVRILERHIAAAGYGARALPLPKLAGAQRASGRSCASNCRFALVRSRRQLRPGWRLRAKSSWRAGRCAS